MYDDEATIEEMIQIELCGIEAVIHAVPEADPLFFQIRDQLAILLDQLQRGKILAEYAEVQLEEIQGIKKQWLRDNPIPPD